MARIAIYHPLSGNGGGEAVCLNAIEALQEEHDIIVLTFSDFDIEMLNQRFNTAADPSTSTRRLGMFGEAIRRVHTVLGGRFGLGRLFTTLFGLGVRGITDDYDAIISTYGEFGFDSQSVSYIYYPMYNRHRLHPEPDRLSPTSYTYDRLVSVLAAPGQHDRTDHKVALSEWTADRVEHIYDTRPQVIYPPVETNDLDPQPWAEREDGFVAVGRIVPDKRIETIIDIVVGLRERGHDVHAHIVGPAGDDDYVNRIRNLAAESSGIHLEGVLDRPTLARLLCTHKYGIHAMPGEPFGIVVAEFIAAGAIPFVHDSGGQREIVAERSEFLYTDIPDAIDTIEPVLVDQSAHSQLFERLPDVEARFGRERFIDEISEAVEAAISDG